jgi:Sulfotransferase family
MQISLVDYWLARFNYLWPSLLHRAGDFESAWLAERLDTISIERPIFISGLARAGSTMLLELLAKHPDLATHRYSDFPFLCTPYCWDWLRTKLTRGAIGQPIARPHQDGIEIDLFSPESMEEPLWQGWFPWIHQADKLHTIPETCCNQRFERFYLKHLAKILLLRAKPRYLSKNNYLLTRLNYLFHLFPDARLLVPVRHPIEHVESLIRQHKLFCEYARQSSRVAGYMQAAGHYEFGPQRVGIRLAYDSAQRSEQFWADGQEQSGYAVQWASLYSAMLQFFESRPELSDRLLIVHYEEFCRDPHAGLARIRAHCQLETALVDLSHIKPPKASSHIGNSTECAVIEQETRHVAYQLGY